MLCVGLGKVSNVRASIIKPLVSWLLLPFPEHGVDVLPKDQYQCLQWKIKRRLTP